jgi:hypothetical protein
MLASSLHPGVQFASRRQLFGSDGELSMITAIGGAIIALSDGLPTSASRPL